MLSWSWYSYQNGWHCTKDISHTHCSTNYNNALVCKVAACYELSASIPIESDHAIKYDNDAPSIILLIVNDSCQSYHNIDHKAFGE